MPNIWSTLDSWGNGICDTWAQWLDFICCHPACRKVQKVFGNVCRKKCGIKVPMETKTRRCVLLWLSAFYFGPQNSPKQANVLLPKRELCSL